jgi:hypothetical protein
MATIYLRSTDGDDADNGTTWALAKATLASAVTAAGTGGLIYVSKSHAETYSSTATTDFGGTSAADTVLVLAVDDAGDPEPPTTLVKGTDASCPVFTISGSITKTFSGYFYWYGLEWFTSGLVNAVLDFGSANIGSVGIVEDCYFNMTANGSGSGLRIGNSTNSIFNNFMMFRNLAWVMSTTSNGCWQFENAFVVFEGGYLTPGGTTNSFLGIDITADRTLNLTMRDFDLSGMGSGQYLIGDVNQATWQLALERCKLPTTFNFVETSADLESTALKRQGATLLMGSMCLNTIQQQVQ